jgi:type IX secretion system PorP/SprF family membrane protein
MPLVTCSFSGVYQVYSQDVAMHTQGILQQEFLNPAYNSFRDYISLSVYNRAQWGSKFEYSPESYVANLFMPMKKTRLGINLGVIVEDIGLRTTTELKASFCHNLRFTRNSFLAFGYSVGFLQSAFNRDGIISYPDEDLSLLLEQVDQNTLYPAVSVGMLFLSRKWFAGISSMTTSIKDNMDDSQYLPGLDFAWGGLIPLSSWVRMRTGLIIKYYNEKGIKSENGVVTDNYRIPVIYDVAANFLIYNKFWIGTSHRFNQAQTFSVDLKLGASLKVGYTFEWGIGTGLNQFNSHGIRLSYSMKHKGEESINDGLDIWPENGGRKDNMATFIY